MSSGVGPALGMAVYGAGRAGRALVAAALRAGVAVQTIWTRSPETARRAARELGCHVASGPQLPTADGVQLALLAVSDEVVADLTRALTEAGALANVRVVAHLGGALGVEVLAPARELGCAVGSLHPLRSLVGASSGLEGCWCALDGDPLAVNELRHLAKLIGCRTVKVGADARALYHAGAALAANDVVALLAAAAEALQAAGLHDGDALGAAVDLARSAIDNVARLGTAAALTGPAARGDAVTISRHLAALAGLRPDLADIHRELSRQLVALSRQQGTPPDRLQHLLDVLDRA
ncbi:MAG: DUF2520 domain-containing protein [Deltaproteobacteria bacterium]|nr:DUF2520 domain-containing protein [Deltaproteobacteria bacterium]